MKLEIRKTNDGSVTLYRPDLDETYHSIHGARQESMHVFIKKGLQFLEQVGCKDVRILEIGFGTGYNALLSELYKSTETSVFYHGIELHPIANEVTIALSAADVFLEENAIIFNALHHSYWEEECQITPSFTLLKSQASVFDYPFKLAAYNLIYFDAFGFRAQEEMWSTGLLQKCYDALEKGGVLVTYAAKGVIRRDLEKVGFTCERLPGPPGKREMLRAIKGCELKV